MASALVPELYVSNLDASLAFYAPFGFTVRYARSGDRFAYLEREGAELMLEEPRGRTWLGGPLDRPFGRGVNLQIAVADVDRLHAVAVDLGAPILLPLEEQRYHRTSDIVTVRQFVVADPDGYLLRFSQLLGQQTAVDNPPITP